MKTSLTLETPWGATLRALCLGLVLLGFLPSLRAQQFGLFSYQNLGDAIEITGYPRDAVGTVEIPAVIDGLPVTSIGFAAFLHCTGLTSVTIPSSVTNIRELDPDQLPHLEEYWGMVVGAFAGCTGLTNLTLPSSLTSIGDSMFAGCTALTSVTLEQGLKTIGASMFVGCTGLTNVTIPVSVTSIGEYAFSGCTGLTSVTLEQGLTTIGSSMFAGCTGLTSVTIPSSVTSIGSGAFSGCTRLGSFVVELGNTVYSSIEGVLVNAAQTALVLFPQGKAGHYGIPSSVTSIAGGAFSGCTGLTSVSIPASVTSIGSSAFSGCTGLGSVTIPSSVTQISDRTFSGCTGLTNVTMPSSITSIGWYALSGCTALGSVTIPSSVASIGWSAFSGCTGLSSVNIPSSVTHISDRTFFGCTRLTHVSIPSSVTNIGSLLPPPSPLNPYRDSEQGGAFAGCTGLTSVDLSSNLTNIGEATFAGCTGLTSVSLPSNLGTIGGTAFAGCTGLTNVSLPSNLRYIGWSAFAGCSGLTSVTVPGRIESGAFAGCSGLTHVTFLPGMTALGSDLFSGCTGLVSVNLPASLIYISEDAFRGCSGLESFVVEPGNTVYASDDGVLLNAARTELIRCPAGRVRPYMIPSSVTRLNDAFTDCIRLTRVTLSKGVTEAYAFSGCAALQAIEVVPQNPVLASVDGVLFSKNQYFLLQYPRGKVGSYTIPFFVINIVSGAFGGCTALTGVTLPEGLANIGDYAFFGCTGLTSVIIPSSVTNIYARAFNGCTALTRTVFLGNAPSRSQAFVDNAPEFTIYYLSSRKGFSVPTWDGHPATRINEATYPAASWLLTHGFEYDTNLNQDPNGDGVDLRTAYALNLDPRLNLQGRLPGPLLGADTLSLNFHASSPGITYRVETSTDLTHWTTTGVTQTAPGADGRSTASVLRDAPQRFLRLSVQD